jgi:hypothetical protein
MCQTLAEEVCGLRCDVWRASTTTATDIMGVLGAGGCIVVPYDSHPGTRMPSLNGGRSAHYGVIVGVMVPASTEGESDASVRTRLVPCVLDSVEMRMWSSHSEAAVGEEGL